MLKTSALALAAALFAASSAYACDFHTAQNQTPVDYSKLEMKQVAEIPVDAWLIKYLEEWQKA